MPAPRGTVQGSAAELHKSPAWAPATEGTASAPTVGLATPAARGQSFEGQLWPSSPAFCWFGTLASGVGEMIWRAHPLHGMTSPDARSPKFVAVQLP